MKKLGYLLATLALAAVLGYFVHNVWQTTSYLKDNGRPATLKIESRYNASTWAKPLPLKKQHAYAAVMAPSYLVLIETAQDLPVGEEIFVLFGPGKSGRAAREMSLRPIEGSLRLRGPEDGVPVQVADTDMFDRWQERAMGPIGPETPGKPAPAPEPVVDAAKPRGGLVTVPLLIGGAQASVLELIWLNSRWTEWVLLLIAVLFIKVLALNAWSLPWNERRSGTDSKKFVHPAMRRVDPDSAMTPSAKIKLTPSRAEEDVAPARPAPASAAPAPVAPAPVSPSPAVAPASEPAADAAAPRRTIPAPASTTSTPAAPTQVSTSVTAPPMPLPNVDPNAPLVLKRKPKPEPEGQ